MGVTRAGKGRGVKGGCGSGCGCGVQWEREGVVGVVGW